MRPFGMKGLASRASGWWSAKASTWRRCTDREQSALVEHPPCVVNGLRVHLPHLQNGDGIMFFPGQITAQLAAVRALGIVSIAVVFAHAYTFPDHEQQVRWMVPRSVCHLRSLYPACGCLMATRTLYRTGDVQVRAIAEGLGFTQISLSSAVMPMVKMVARGFTTTADRCE